MEPLGWWRWLALGTCCSLAATFATDNPNLACIMDVKRSRFPNCIVWTPIPLITWFLPFVGHMGICTSSGIIRDFAGPYVVSEDNMAFGNPTKYWKLDPSRTSDADQGWDRAVSEASEEYKGHMHNLCCDNCHSHVALALNLMRYDSSSDWNMVKLGFLMLVRGRYVNVCGFIKTWLPFALIVTAALTLFFVF